MTHVRCATAKGRSGTTYCITHNQATDRHSPSEEVVHQKRPAADAGSIPSSVSAVSAHFGRTVSSGDDCYM
jgi:hypothetical protein